MDRYCPTDTCCLERGHPGECTDAADCRLGVDLNVVLDLTDPPKPAAPALYL